MPFVKNLEDLRTLYINASPHQRMKVVRERIESNDTSVSLLVNMVSGIEALSRSIFVEHLEQTGRDRTQAYRSVKLKKTIPLVKDVFRLKGIDADDFFEDDTWRIFQNAVEYRNLIVHECTFLRQDYCSKLIESCRLVLEAIYARI